LSIDKGWINVTSVIHVSPRLTYAVGTVNDIVHMCCNKLEKLVCWWTYTCLCLWWGITVATSIRQIE